MSCGGSAKDNANQAAVQGACAPYRGKVTTREAAGVFHRLAADRKAELQAARPDDGKPIPGGKRATGRADTQEAHAHARAELPRAVADLAATKETAHLADPYSKKTYAGYDGTLTEVGADDGTGSRRIRVQFDTGTTNRGDAERDAHASFDLEDPSVQLSPGDEGRWRAVASFHLAGQEGKTTEQVLPRVHKAFLGTPRHRQSVAELTALQRHDDVYGRPGGY